MGKYAPRDGQTSMRVLLVDQDFQVLAIVQTLLEHYGHDVRTASSCKEALALTGELQPHVVFTGIVLMASSGFELVKELRERADCAGIVVIALTGNDALMNSESWVVAGFDRVLRKPANIEDIVGVLDDIVAGRKWVMQEQR